MQLTRPKGMGGSLLSFSRGISLLNGKDLAEKLPLHPSQKAGQWQAQTAKMSDHLQSIHMNQAEQHANK